MAGVRIQVVKYDPTDPRLGRHVEHDERSWEHRFLAKQQRPQKKTTHWTSIQPALDQGDVGSCTGNAVAQWLNTGFGQQLLREPLFHDENDALNIYSKATHLDSIPGHYKPDDTGSSGTAACKAATKLSYIKGYSWLFSFSSVQAAIETTPLITGTLWTNDMFNPTNGLVKIGSLVDSNIAGGHEYLMTGIDWTEEVFEFRQSWGDTNKWHGCKPGGYFAISFRDYIQLYAANGDVTVPKVK